MLPYITLPLRTNVMKHPALVALQVLKQLHLQQAQGISFTDLSSGIAVVVPLVATR